MREESTGPPFDQTGVGVQRPSRPRFWISRSAPKPGIFHRRSNGEMIEALPGAIFQAQGIVHHVIKVTPDARGPHPRCFGSQIETLSDYARFPEQLPIRMRTSHPQDRLKLRQHSQTERAIGSDVLMAGNSLGEASQIVSFQLK